MEVFIPGSCVPKARPVVRYNPKRGRYYAFTPKRTRMYADAARAVARSVHDEAGVEPISKGKGVAMTVEFVRRGKTTSRPDIINMLAQVADLLQTVSYEDDCQIVELHAYKRRGKIAMTRIQVKEEGG